MRGKKLSSLLRVVSGLFFVLVCLLFLATVEISSALAGWLPQLQFVPALMQAMHAATPGVVGLILILVLTILLGRIYCSSVCPLGALQDLISYLARKKKRPAVYRFSKPGNNIRYLVLGLTVLLLIMGSGVLLALLDPFSVFGRILSNLVRPVLLVLGNTAATALEQFGLYTISRKQWALVAPVSLAISLAMLALVGFLAARRGRLYCNTICPVGTLLGLLSRFSLVRLRLDPGNCTSCRACVHVCKAGCIDISSMRVDDSRCVACYDCLAVCTHGAISLQNSWRRTRPATSPDKSRRDYLLHSGGYLLGLTVLSGQPEAARTIIQSKPTTIAEAITCPVSPPGSVSIARFTSRCTACHLCVSACPSSVLAPSFLEYGLAGIMQPRLNFRSAHCNYECTICMDLCPTGAIGPLTPDEKKLTQTGIAKFIKENCVVYTDNTTCGACSEHCPTKAVRMVPYENPLGKPLVIPELKTDYCIGCGGCEHACPTKPYKAIFVDGHPVHKLAKKPEVQKVDQQDDFNGDFPF